MWTVVYMAADKELINSVCAMLKQNEIILKLRAVKKADENNGTCYEILVPDAEVEKAQELIFEAEIN